MMMAVDSDAPMGPSAAPPQILKDIVLRTMAEASSSDRKDFLTFGDFSKVRPGHATGLCAGCGNDGP